MSFICLLFVCSLLAFPVNTTCGAEMSHGLNKRLHKKKKTKEKERERKLQKGRQLMTVTSKISQERPLDESLHLASRNLTFRVEHQILMLSIMWQLSCYQTVIFCMSIVKSKTYCRKILGCLHASHCL